MTTENRLTLFRTYATGIPAGDNPIDRSGGDYGAGLIQGFSAATAGEARGQDLFLDGTFLGQVATAINAEPNGAKSRFTHPGSADGLGKFLGRVKNARVDPSGGSNQVLADSHLAKSAHNTPHGDLAGYTMDLAEQDPDMFGASLAFARDYAAENAYMANHSVDGQFHSPDPANVRNLPHVRLGQLAGVDVVDDPAANPSGLFDSGDRNLLVQFLSTIQPKELAMAKTKTEEKPAETKPADVKAPVETKPVETAEPATVETEVEEESEEEPAVAQAGAAPVAVPARDTRMSSGQKFLTAFGDKGGRWFAEGKTYEEAQQLFVADLKSEQAALKAKVAELETKFGRGEASPATFGGAKSADEKQLAELKGKTGSDGLAKFAAGIKMPS